MTAGSENVRDALSSATGAPFQIARPGPNRLLVRRDSVWFVISWDIGYMKKTAHLKAAWKDKKGHIWFESSKIADMIRLVEREYGEDGVGLMPDAGVGVVPPQSMPAEVAEFPNVIDHLRRYEEVVSEVGRRNGVQMKLLYDGGAGITSVRALFTAPVFDERNADDARRVVGLASKVLKEAYEECLTRRSDASCFEQSGNGQ